MWLLKKMKMMDLKKDFIFKIMLYAMVVLMIGEIILFFQKSDFMSVVLMVAVGMFALNFTKNMLFVLLVMITIPSIFHTLMP